MKGALHLGSPFGIGLYVHWTFGLLIALLYFTFGLPGVAFVVAIFACVTLHEYGHVLAARRYGIPTHSVTLYPIGGVARLAGMPRNPKQEIVIALAGPAVNVAIAALVLPFALLYGSDFTVRTPGAEGAFLAQLVLTNVSLLLFNMIPAFPMDGGRVFRGVLAFGGDYARATHIAARTGQGIAVLFALYGVFAGHVLLVVIAAFIFMAAAAERRMVMLQQRFGATPPPIPQTNPDDPQWEILPPESGQPASRRRPETGPDRAAQVRAAFEALRRQKPHWRSQS